MGISCQPGEQYVDQYKRHVMVINRSFWPDVEATGQFLTELCEGLSGTYRVTAVAGRSYYIDEPLFRGVSFFRREQYKTITILRVRHTVFPKSSVLGRMINWATFSLAAFTAGLMTNPDIIIACTDPPFLGTIGAVLSRLKGAAFVYNCRDLYPDVAYALHKLSKKNIFGVIFSYLNKHAFSSADAVVFLGESMRDRVKEKRVSSERFFVIPDWVDTSLVKPIPRNENRLFAKLKLEDKFIIMYSGNIGLSQEFDTLVSAVSALEKKLFYLIFIGDGAGKKDLEETLRRRNLTNALMTPRQPIELLSSSLSMADLHIISLKKGMAGASVPSKVYAIMAAGRPYLALMDRESEPVEYIERYGCGMWADPDDAQKIGRAIDWAFHHKSDLEKMGSAGRRIAESVFDKKIVQDKWLALLCQLK